MIFCTSKDLSSYKNNPPYSNSFINLTVYQEEHIIVYAIFSLLLTLKCYSTAFLQ